MVRSSSSLVMMVVMAIMMGMVEKGGCSQKEESVGLQSTNSHVLFHTRPPFGMARTGFGPLPSSPLGFGPLFSPPLWSWEANTMSLWSAEMVSKGQSNTITIDGNTESDESGTSSNLEEKTLTFFWKGMEVDAQQTVNVSCVVQVVDEQYFQISLEIKTFSSMLGVWSYTLRAQGQLFGEGGHSVVRNSGFGVLSKCSSSSSSPFSSTSCDKGFQEDYPRGTFQFIATYKEEQPNTGFYMATHDPFASSKMFSFQGLEQTHPGIEENVLISREI